MAKKISELAELNSAPETNDYFPLIDTSANETKRVSSENLLKRVKPVVLYEDSTGTTGNVQFSGALSNFSFLEVFYYKEGGVMYGSTKIDVSKRTGHIFDGIDYSNASAFQLYCQTLTASQNASLISPTITIAKGTGRYVNLITDGSNVISTGTENTTYIYKVLGWY